MWWPGARTRPEGYVSSVLSSINQMPLLASLACATPRTPHAKAVPEHISSRRTTRISEGGVIVLPNNKVSDRSQPPLMLDLSLCESAGPGSLHRWLRLGVRGRDREWHQMRLLEFGLFQIPHLSVCLDGEQSVANASTENQ